jgi:MFS family permease
MQTGWGPFMAAYLTSVAWSQFDIGLVLTIGTVAAFTFQVPAGMLVDRIPALRLTAAFASIAIGVSALMLALWPTFESVVAGKLLHTLASSLAGPAVAAISLGLVGHAALGARLGRNARFLSLGNAIAAGLFGACAWYYSNRAIFFLTALLCIPTIIALMQIRGHEIDRNLARGGIGLGVPAIERGALQRGALTLLHDRAFLVFAAAVLLFQLGNAAMMPILAGALTLRMPEWATPVIAVCILAPQIVVAVIAPRVGRAADRRGRKPLLLLCFGALAARGIVFTFTNDPTLIIATQLLDGISAAALGVLVPLILADVTRGSGNYSVAMGGIGVAVGVGASISTAAAGYIADLAGQANVFLFLAGAAVVGAAVVLAFMPETKPQPSPVTSSSPTTRSSRRLDPR